MSKAKSMNSIGYWRIKKLKNSLLLIIKRLLYRFYSFYNRKEREIPFTVKLLFELFKKVIISTFVVFFLFYIDSRFILWETLKVNYTLLSDALIAGVSISGIFLGLFFANMSTVYSSRYANAPESVRALFENDLITNTSIKSIIQYIILTLTILVSNFAGNTPGIITILIIMLYSIKIIISFALIGKRMYQFSDTYEITSSIYNDLHKLFDNVSKKKLFKNDISFQHHFQKRCTKLIKILAEINDFNFEENRIRSSSILNFMINNINIFCGYWKIKNYINYNSLWFKEKYLYKKWSLTDDHEIAMALATGTTLKPNHEKDYFWLEDTVFSINEKCLNRMIEDKNFSVLLSYMKFISNMIKFAVESFSVEYFIRQITIIETLINKLSEYEDKLEDEFAAIMDTYTLMYVNFGLSINEYLSKVNIETLIESSIKIISYQKIPIKKYPFLNNKQMEKFFDGINAEINIEQKRITPEWFIKQMVAQNYYNKLIEFAKYIDYIHNEKLIELGVNLIKKERYFSAMVILSRATEINSKFKTSIDFLDKAFKQLKRWHIEKSFTWIENPTEDIIKKCSNTLIKLPELWIKSTTALTILKKDKLKDYPDFLGYSYNNLCELGITAIEENNYELFEKVYDNLLPFSLLYQEETRKTLIDISLGKIKDAHLKVFLSPILEYSDISGYSILWGELFSDMRWKELVERKLKDHLSKFPASEGMADRFISAIKGAEGLSFGFYNRDIIHTQWQQRIYSRIRESKILEYEYNTYYDKTLKTDNEFLKAYLGHDLNYGFNHAYEIYAVICLNKYASSEFIYVSNSKWEEVFQEGNDVLYTKIPNEFVYLQIKKV